MQFDRITILLPIHKIVNKINDRIKELSKIYYQIDENNLNEGKLRHNPIKYITF